MPKLGWLEISERRSGAITLTALDAQREPRNLRRVKSEVLRRWGTVPLVDMLKETVLRTGCLDAVTSVTAGGSIRPEVLAERLLLAINAYWVDQGLKGFLDPYRRFRDATRTAGCGPARPVVWGAPG